MNSSPCRLQLSNYTCLKLQPKHKALRSERAGAGSSQPQQKQLWSPGAVSEADLQGWVGLGRNVSLESCVSGRKRQVCAADLRRAVSLEELCLHQQRRSLGWGNIHTLWEKMGYSHMALGCPLGF